MAEDASGVEGIEEEDQDPVLDHDATGRGFSLDDDEPYESNATPADPDDEEDRW